MTQAQLILDYLKYHQTITPAKMAGSKWQGEMFGSETSKRCRELRMKKKLVSKQEGKFEVFSSARPEQIIIKEQDSPRTLFGTAVRESTAYKV